MDDTRELLSSKHVSYIHDLFRHPAYLEHYMADHLKMNALYWGIIALHVLNEPLPSEEVITFVLSCYDSKSGGFCPAPKHDPHMLSTLSAIQLLKLYDSLAVLSSDQKKKIVEYIKSMQLPDGSFQGDSFGEVDTRFVYNAIQALSILEELTPDIVDPAINWILQCQNFDGSFGLAPGAESHSAQVFTCLGTLAIVGALDRLPNRELLEWWLSDRQVPSGGFNGRPEKLPDACYSWWVGSCLKMLDKMDYIDKDKLSNFILSCQGKDGGISDRPGKAVDVYHTCFGLTGLSLLGYKGLAEIDPKYCLPVNVTRTIKEYPYK
ncbi:Rab geranylgeranyltransferase [Martiniozyma asiatica (nom. inval.)]|nr:Rab geranylgeranyltransferase [Martiniozyma asiatica]